MRGFLVGGLGLVVLYRLLNARPQYLTGVAKVPGALISAYLDPNRPLVPNRAGYSDTTTSYQPGSAPAINQLFAQEPQLGQALQGGRAGLAAGIDYGQLAHNPALQPGAVIP